MPILVNPVSNPKLWNYSVKSRLGPIAVTLIGLSSMERYIRIWMLLDSVAARASGSVDPPTSKHNIPVI